jgi:hypothetical protein
MYKMRQYAMCDNNCDTIHFGCASLLFATNIQTKSEPSMTEHLIVVPGFVKDDKLRELLEFCGNQTYVLPPYRGKYLKRSPKATFVLTDEVGVYRFGQETRAYGNAIVGYPQPLMDLVIKIADDFEDFPNHCIIVRYSDGKEHHIPWHSDKQEGTSGGGAKDICSYTKIYDIIIFEEGDESNPALNRKFQVALSDKITVKTGGHGDASLYLYNERTPNGDMIVLTFEGNCAMKHCVPKEKGNDVVRYSIVFRTVKTKEEQGVNFEYGKQEEVAQDDEHDDDIEQAQEEVAQDDEHDDDIEQAQEEYDGHSEEGTDEDDYDTAMAEYYAHEDAEDGTNNPATELLASYKCKFD